MDNGFYVFTAKMPAFSPNFQGDKIFRNLKVSPDFRAYDGKVLPSYCYLNLYYHWNPKKLYWFLKLLYDTIIGVSGIWDCRKNFWDGNLLTSTDDQKPLTFVTQGFVFGLLQ